MDKEQLAAAKAHLKHWQAADIEPALTEELALISKSPEAYYEAFFQPITFGTAGMRGELGVGPNRVNTYTVRQVTLALAQLLEAEGEAAKAAGVVLAYDNRHGSTRFAREAAALLSSQGIKTYLFTEPRPTPELSFAVRELGTFAGIMLTASHNPKNYNGYKLYGADGAQMVPEHVDRLLAYRKHLDPLAIALPAWSEVQVEELPPAWDKHYLKAIAPTNIQPELLREASSLKIVYTALEGTGQALMTQAFAQAGYSHLTTVLEQAQPNADFAHTASPNPEEAQAFSQAKVYGEREQADLLLASDPDADRLGAMVPDDTGTYQVLTGNQIASLLLAYCVEAAPVKTGQVGVLMKSIVSGELPAVIAKKKGLKVLETLTGFKWLAEQIAQLEGQDHDQLTLAFEESYGFLRLPVVRDKDAIQAALLLSEVAAYHKKHGRSLWQALTDLFETYGYHLEKTLAIKKPGEHGQAEIKTLLANLRAQPKKTIAGTPVLACEDYERGKVQWVEGGERALSLPQSNVLKYRLADETWLALRPSGTEPKLKIYLGVKSKSRAEAKARLAHYEAEVNTWLT